MFVLIKTLYTNPPKCPLLFNRTIAFLCSILCFILSLLIRSLSISIARSEQYYKTQRLSLTHAQHQDISIFIRVSLLLLLVHPPDDMEFIDHHPRERAVLNSHPPCLQKHSDHPPYGQRIYLLSSCSLRALNLTFSSAHSPALPCRLIFI